MKAFSIWWMALLAGSCYSNQSIQEKQPVRMNELSSYICKIPITKLSSTQNPCVEILIENKPFTVNLDLGFKGTISISDTAIDQVLSKTLLDTETRTNVLGKAYSVNIYSLPEFKIGTLTVSQIVLQKRNTELRNDVYFSAEQDVLHSVEDQGSLGWELFSHGTLLINIKNLNIVVSDTLETLNKQGISIEEFVKVPLITERGLIEFEAETINGPILCVLDTGSTWNIVNSNVDDNKSLSQIILDPKNRSEHSVFKIGRYNFGPVSFRSVPIKTPFHVEAVLGMDFFSNHVVILDFVNKFIYLSNSSDSSE
jgi:hypothetical protein